MDLLTALGPALVTLFFIDATRQAALSLLVGAAAGLPAWLTTTLAALALLAAAILFSRLANRRAKRETSPFP